MSECNRSPNVVYGTHHSNNRRLARRGEVPCAFTVMARSMLRSARRCGPCEGRKEKHEQHGLQVEWHDGCKVPEGHACWREEVMSENGGADI